MRKTKKFYRELLTKDLYSALRVLPEVIAKYGVKPYSTAKRGNKRFNISRPDEYWNCYIEGFENYNKKTFINLYWQGDSTDGMESIVLNPLKTSYVIPEESYWDGYRTRHNHSDLRISSDDLMLACKKIANSL